MSDAWDAVYLAALKSQPEVRATRRCPEVRLEVSKTLEVLQSHVVVNSLVKFLLAAQRARFVHAGNGTVRTAPARPNCPSGLCSDYIRVAAVGALVASLVEPGNHPRSGALRRDAVIPRRLPRPTKWHRPASGHG